MSDKPIALLVAALVVAPLCATCILGPVVLGSMIAGMWGWFSGNGVLVAATVVIVVAVLGYALKRRHSREPSAVTDARAPARRHTVEAQGGVRRE